MYVPLRKKDLHETLRNHRKCKVYWEITNIDEKW